MEPRRRLYIDPDVQFPLILALLFFVAVEGAFFGWGFAKAIAVARQWDRPDQAAAFFKTLLLCLVPFVAVNFAAGAWLSHKIAGPLLSIRKAMERVGRGDLEVEVVLRRGDFLHAQAQEMNRLVQTLRRLLYRDHAHAAEVDALMTQEREWLARQKDLPEPARAELRALIDGAKSRLSIINAHFVKGRSERPEAS